MAGYYPQNCYLKDKTNLKATLSDTTDRTHLVAIWVGPSIDRYDATISLANC